MKVGILGTGAYGLAISSLVRDNHHDVVMWTAFEEEKKLLVTKRENKTLLKGYTLDKNIEVTTDLKMVLNTCDLIFVVIPVAFISNVMKDVSKYVRDDNHFCIASKGIEQETGFFVTDILENSLNTKNIAVISGPTFAVDLPNESPKGLTLASYNDTTRSLVRSVLESKKIRLEDSDDVIGVEISGAIKNVIAISSGILDGIGVCASTKAMFLTKAMLDMRELLTSLGGKEETLITYAFFGDLYLTCTSKQSRNYTYGILIGKGSKRRRKLYEETTTIEGLNTLKSIYHLLKDNKIKIPIITIIYNIVIRGHNEYEMVKYLES